MNFRFLYSGSPQELLRLTHDQKGNFAYGQLELLQRCVHALFTTPGSDFSAPSYGCFLINTFKNAVFQKDINTLYNAAKVAVRKAQTDIITIQSADNRAYGKAPSSQLRSLELLDVRADLELYAWIIDIRVVSQDGEESSLTLPIGL